MNKLFAARRSKYHTQNIKYLRYVFNDHFVLFLMILIGALAVQYAQFLRDHALENWQKALLVLFISLLSLVFGRLATFIEPADKVFLLVQEENVKKYLWRCLLRSLLIPGLISAVLVGIAAPLVKLGLPILVLWFVLLLALKAGLLAQKLLRLLPHGLLQWEALIAYEERRKTNTLKFFALFTTVKGLRSPSHRRKYLDFLLPKTKRTYEYLFSRSYLRTGDYLGLTLRLLLLALLALIFVSNSLLAAILVAVLNYLLIFQLLSLYHSYDYQLLTRIYPLKKSAKDVAVRSVLLRVISFITIVELIAGAVFLENRLYLIAIFLINFLLMKFYVRFRLKK